MDRTLAACAGHPRVEAGMRLSPDRKLNLRLLGGAVFALHGIWNGSGD